MHSWSRGIRRADQRKTPLAIGIRCMHVASIAASRHTLTILLAVLMSKLSFTSKSSKDICNLTKDLKLARLASKFSIGLGGGRCESG